MYMNTYMNTRKDLPILCAPSHLITIGKSALYDLRHGSILQQHSLHVHCRGTIIILGAIAA